MLRPLKASLASGFTSLRILLRLYPRAFDSDRQRTDAVLRAFASAVVPGVSEEDPDVTRPFHDENLSPIPKYSGFLAADLSVRAGRRFAGRRFETLDVSDRTTVIQDGLAADSRTKQLYEGAIFLFQIARYAGIYDDEAGCPLIGFEGSFEPRPWSEITYDDPESFLARTATLDGNHA